MDEDQALPPDLAALGDQVRDAYEVAASAHAGQHRKDNGAPFITHPVAVARIAAEAELDGGAVAAALLHDVLEKSDTTAEELRERFPEGIVGLIEAMTENEAIEPYERRKDAHRDQVERAGEAAALLYGADKLANLRDLRQVYAELGERAADRYKSSLDLRVELWRRDLEMIERVAGPNGHIGELRAELEEFGRERACR